MSRPATTCWAWRWKARGCTAGSGSKPVSCPGWSSALFIELTEILACPREHEESYLICAPALMEGRRVVRGGLGCPSCGAEYPILDGVAWFAPPDGRSPGGSPATSLTADAIQAFIDLQGAGGYALLVGSAASCGAPLAGLIPGVHFFCVNPPAGVDVPRDVSVLRSPIRLPVKSRSVRAVVVGADHGAEPWLEDACRTLLRGLRFVAETEGEPPKGVTVLARAAGVLVGEKRDS